jgi:hypothetical protein
VRADENKSSALKNFIKVDTIEVHTYLFAIYDSDKDIIMYLNYFII